jgi:hypothetical protein
MLATLAAAGSVVKTISPQTTPYVDLAAIGVGLIIGLAGVFKGHATAVSAITTPGTTDGPVTSAPVAAGAAAAGTNAVASRN